MTTRILLIATLALFALPAMMAPLTTASAGELDNESSVINEQAVRAKDLPQTVVVRIDEATGAASVLESKTALSADSKGLNDLQTMASSFKPVNASGATELDRDSSASSWHAWYNYSYYYAPVYYYYGYSYSYTNYYSYRSYGYSYYWYRWY